MVDPLEKYRMLKISREKEASLPSFSSHDEARKYFKDIYGNKFQMTDSFMVDDLKCYSYILVLDQKAFDKGRKEMEKNGLVGGSDYFLSTQVLQIMEDGSVHINH